MPVPRQRCEARASGQALTATEYERATFLCPRMVPLVKLPYLVAGADSDLPVYFWESSGSAMTGADGRGCQRAA